MKTIIMKNSILLFITLIFFILANWLQQHLELHGDVNYLINIAQSVLSGKRQYGIDFFETNPPMILYLYFPVLLLKKYSSLELVNCLRLYIYFLVVISFFLSNLLLRDLIKNKITLIFFNIIMLYTLLIFPVNQLGQREHLFFILILPYIFAAAVKLDNKQLTLPLAIVIGMLAGFGFAIKPYFIFPLIFIESYLVLKSKRLWGWVRIETVIILAILVMYLVTTFIFYKTYFTIMLPLIKQFYFIGIKEPFINILLNRIVIFSVAVLFLSAMQLNTKHPALKTILFLSLFGSIITLLSTQTSWFYHAIPMLGIACLLLSLYFSEFIAEFFTKFSHLFFTLPLLIILFYIPFSTTYYQLIILSEDKKSGANTLLMQYILEQPGSQSIACFSVNTTADCFPLALKTHSTYGSRYPFFWWLRGLIAVKNNKTMSEVKLAKYENYFVNNIAMDLNSFQPRWIIINTFSKKIIFGDNFSFINFFSQNESFRNAWSAYNFKTTIGCYKVYERQSRA